MAQTSDDNPGPTLSEHPRTSPRSSARPIARAQVTTSETTESTAPSRTGRSHPNSNSHMTARQAMESSGVGRMKTMAMAMLGLSGVGMITAFAFKAHPITRSLAVASLLTLVALFVVTFRRLRESEAADTKMIRRLSIPLCSAVVLGNVAFGLTSVYCVAVALGLLLFASSSARKNALLAYGILAGGFGAFSLATQFDLYPYPPIAPASFPEPGTFLASCAMVEVMYLAAFLAGRRIRREQARMVDKFERAVREASLRDALLREARDALKNAAGIGAPGRFTDQELDGFKLGPVIGRGGMGEVYEAERMDDGRAAAVKLLRMDALGERSALSRFEREARIIASIQSPNVVQVLAVSNADSALPYIAMERLSGVDLASHLREKSGRLPLAEVVELVAQVAIGLSAAHAAKVVHRDLKPNNLFRCGTSDKPTWKILDFGVSKWMESADATLTAAELVGTPQYMAPEQARGDRDLDQCADIYALSAIAYRALTGEAPFGGQLPAILRTIAEQMPRAPSSYAELPRDLDYVLAIGLAKSRRDRFQSAAEFASALASAASGNLDSAWVKHAKALLSGLPYAK